LSYIDELKAVIRHGHHVESEHVESVPVKEVFQGKTVWDGIVEVFDLKSSPATHPSVNRVYAWSYDSDNPNEGPHHVTILHTHPVKSAQDAVRAFIVQEYRNLGTAEEE
jgi:hypothetical protein